MRKLVIALAFVSAGAVANALAHDAIKDGKVIDKDVVLNRANFLRAYPELGLSPAECTNPVFYENDVDRDGDFVRSGDEMCYNPCEVIKQPDEDIVVGGAGNDYGKPTLSYCN